MEIFLGDKFGIGSVRGVWRGFLEVFGFKFFLAHVSKVVKLEGIIELLAVDRGDFLVVGVKDRESVGFFLRAGIELVLSSFPLVKGDSYFLRDLVESLGRGAFEENCSEDHSKD